MRKITIKVILKRHGSNTQVITTPFYLKNDDTISISYDEDIIYNDNYSHEDTELRENDKHV